MPSSYLAISADNVTGSKDKILAVLLVAGGLDTLTIPHGCFQKPYFVSIQPLGTGVYTERVYVSSITDTDIVVGFENVATSAIFQIRLHRSMVTGRRDHRRP